MRNGWNWKYPLSDMYPAYTQLVAEWSSPSIGDQRATGCRDSSLQHGLSFELSRWVVFSPFFLSSGLLAHGGGARPDNKCSPQSYIPYCKTYFTIQEEINAAQQYATHHHLPWFWWGLCLSGSRAAWWKSVEQRVQQVIFQWIKLRF